MKHRQIVYQLTDAEKKIEAAKKEFLIGLEALTRKTGIEIWVSCIETIDMGVATITDTRSGYGEGKNGVEWFDPSDEDNWNEYSHTIVKGK